MKIETKYNIGDYLYFLENNKVVSKPIEGLTITIDYDNSIKIVCNYHQYLCTIMGPNPMRYVNELDAFFTKEELLKSL